MRKRKTAKANRGTYIYYFDNCKVELTPGVDGISPELIALLHEMDDDECDNNRSETRLDRFLIDGISEDSVSEDKKSYLIDPRMDIEADYIRKSMLDNAMAMLTPEQREIVRLRVELDLTEEVIAGFIGISQQAVSKRLVRAKEKMKKFM